ncbi:uncharacterized protein N7484_006297 [Penicillium longicatenatum]|uniref:uncharacterized protein n=1 Tax=Penicillium longicatenatum TaxID=1561947 RepID=UPI0025499A8F|nr:uncharacterized protein N7484_006297 [Penicillium longicatenatum]KAJ5643790.1 hypothetical protein N7484_006297 [Penicillium longicatenatum]
MQVQQETKIQKLEQGLKRVFAAALDRKEGKITSKQLLRTADRASWDSTRLFDDYLVPAQNLKLDAVGTLFTETGHPGHRFLAELTRKWMQSRHYMPLTLTFGTYSAITLIF